MGKHLKKGVFLVGQVSGDDLRALRGSTGRVERDLLMDRTQQIMTNHAHFRDFKNDRRASRVILARRAGKLRTSSDKREGKEHAQPVAERGASYS